jgi:hypothetical protein
MALTDIPIIECEDAGDAIYILPKVKPILHVPPGGFSSPEDRWQAEWEATLEAYTQAATRGACGVVRFTE